MSDITPILLAAVPGLLVLGLGFILGALTGEPEVLMRFLVGSAGVFVTALAFVLAWIAFDGRDK